MNEVITEPLGAVSAPTKAAISVRGLGKRYRLGAERNTSHSLRDRLTGVFTRQNEAAKKRDFIWALDNVTFDIKAGERVGIVGRNGAGKSTLLKIMSRIVPPTAGEVHITGRLTSLLEVGTGFNDNLTGRENVFLNASLYGLSKREVQDRYADIVAFSEVARFIDTPVKNYSSGMKMRLAFSVAAHLDPDILLLDEVLAVGDVAFQQKCLKRVEQITTSDRTLVFVSHSTGAIRQFCERVVWMQNGQVLMDGPAEDVIEEYTKATLGGRSSVDLSSRDTEQRPRLNSASPNASGVDERPWASIRSVRAIREDETETVSFEADQSIVLEVKYQVSDARPVFPAFRLYRDDTLIATIAYWPDDYPTTPGVYVSRAIIPANFLNTGELKVSVGLNTPMSSRLFRHDIEENALRLYVHEARSTQTPRGPYPSIAGATRPYCQWTTERAVEKRS